MKVIIAGSRDSTTYKDVEEAIRVANWDITEVVSGNARGVDRYGEHWASVNDTPVAMFRANWTLHGKSAGFRRNLQMIDYADAAIFVWDGQSKGTKHCWDNAREAGLLTFMFNVINRQWTLDQMQELPDATLTLTKLITNDLNTTLGVEKKEDWDWNWDE